MSCATYMGLSLWNLVSATSCVTPWSNPSSRPTSAIGRTQGVLLSATANLLIIMFGSLDRKRLVKKGFACSKLRRKPTQKEWMRRLDSDVRFKGGIFVAFAAALA